jgi:hypothetical protein
MDHLHARLERLEQRTHTVERQLRWWRGLTCALVVLSLLSLALSSGKAADAQSGTLTDRLAAWREEVATLRDTLVPITTHIKSATDAQGVPEVVITGANLRIVNGLGSTDCTDNDGNPIPDCPNGLGNLIVGYNEVRVGEEVENIRTGSHNVVVGRRQNFSRFGGLVVGDLNTISGDFASVSGGTENVASNSFAAVSGGNGNTASGDFAASVSGGAGNLASGRGSSVCGGQANVTSGVRSSVSGGVFNTASADFGSVSGGQNNTAGGLFGTWVGGGFNNTANNTTSSVSGGQSNTASGPFSSVSGGLNRTAGGENNWVAGPLFVDE